MTREKMPKVYRFLRKARITGLGRIGVFKVAFEDIRRPPMQETSAGRATGRMAARGIETGLESAGRTAGRMAAGRIETGAESARQTGTKAKSARKKSAKELLTEMDETYCVVRFGNKVRIFAWEKSDIFSSKRPAFYREDALKLFFCNQMISCRDRDGNSTRKLLFPYWLQRAESPRATGLTLEPTPERFVDGKLNLWCGFGLDPAAGKWPLLKAHIEHVVCNDDPQSISYLMKWLAWVLQNPTKNAEVAVVLRGKKGTGKGIFGRVLLSIFASHGQHISNCVDARIAETR